MGAELSASTPHAVCKSQSFPNSCEEGEEEEEVVVVAAAVVVAVAVVSTVAVVEVVGSSAVNQSTISNAGHTVPGKALIACLPSAHPLQQTA